MAGPGTLEKMWGVPPFSVFEPRQEYWKDRKRWWVALGIKSEVGRRGDLLFASQARLDEIQRGKTGGGPAFIDGYRIKEGTKKVGASSNAVGGSKPVFRFGCDYDKSKEADLETLYRSGTSIFDPVLCELYYRWFVPPGGHVLDPFAGGSVRGVVAAALGRKYTGIELRAEQVEANGKQWDEMAAANPRVLGAAQKPRWIPGDSRRSHELAAGEYDSIFSCPPYFDLEVYSDEPGDLSNMSWAQFREAYTEIIARAAGMMRLHRFATFVVTDIRDKDGLYRNLPGLTIEAFEKAGLHFYNEGILVTSVGSLPVRVGNQFRASRKLGRTHQNILTFVKGDPKEAAKACSDAEEEVARTPGAQVAVEGDLFDGGGDAGGGYAPSEVEPAKPPGQERAEAGGDGAGEPGPRRPGTPPTPPAVGGGLEAAPEPVEDVAGEGVEAGGGDGAGQDEHRDEPAPPPPVVPAGPGGGGVQTEPKPEPAVPPDGKGDGKRAAPPPEAIVETGEYRCRQCGSHRAWRSIHGVLSCCTCHPPAHPEVVAGAGALSPGAREAVSSGAFRPLPRATALDQLVHEVVSEVAVPAEAADPEPVVAPAPPIAPPAAAPVPKKVKKRKEKAVEQVPLF